MFSVAKNLKMIDLENPRSVDRKIEKNGPLASKFFIFRIEEAQRVVTDREKM